MTGRTHTSRRRRNIEQTQHRQHHNFGRIVQDTLRTCAAGVHATLVPSTTLRKDFLWTNTIGAYDLPKSDLKNAPMRRRLPGHSGYGAKLIILVPRSTHSGTGSSELF